MIKRNGKTYVVLEFRDESDAAYFETSFFDRAPGDLFEASAQAKISDSAFADLDEVNVTNVSHGNTGDVLQIGRCEGGINIAGRRVQ